MGDPHIYEDGRFWCPKCHNDCTGAMPCDCCFDEMVQDIPVVTFTNDRERIEVRAPRDSQDELRPESR